MLERDYLEHRCLEGYGFEAAAVTMRRLGTWLMWLGIASVVGKLTGLDVFLLIWLDSWGDFVGWVLRFSIIALGYYWLKTGES